MDIPTESKQTLPRAIALLDCFSRERQEIGVREAARLLHISSSAAGRLMQSLKELGVLNQNPSTKAYTLGTRVLTWAGVYSENLELRQLARPSMEELHQLTCETISLYIIDGNERVCVEQFESSQNVRIVGQIGLRLPLYVGSAGKVLLAFFPENRLNDVLNSYSYKPFTDKTIIDPTTLRAELEKIRRQGYAVSHGEWLPDASGLAAPILNSRGEVLAALTISGPSQRFTKTNITRYSAALVRIAGEITRKLGYNPHKP